MLAPILELVIALAFVFLLFSLVVSWINEFITSRLATRGKYLRRQLSEALDDQFNKNWAELLYVHPAVDLLAKREQRPPAYIPGDLFAKGLIDLIINEARIVHYSQDANNKVHLSESLPFQQPINNFNAGLQTLKKSDVQILLQSFLDNSGGDYEKLKANIVTWYDDYMDRVSGWYKKKIRGWLFLISLAVAVVFNVNTIRLVTTLWKNASMRESVVKAAENYLLRHDTLSSPHQKESPLRQNTPSGPQPTQVPDTPRADSVGRAGAGNQTAVPLPGTATDAPKPESELRQLAKRIDSVYLELRVLDLPIGYECACEPGDVEKSSAEGQAAVNAPANNSGSTAPAAGPEGQALCHRTILKDGFFTVLTCAAGQWWRKPNWTSILGWLITAGALSFGAPFWFDVLKKFVNVRSAGIKPERISTEDVKH